MGAVAFLHKNPFSRDSKKLKLNSMFMLLADISQGGSEIVRVRP